ncbi:hypothetical protein PBY51_017438 [Eleginops maclovinus]|uniref:Uncharacterized protein n=1 Tax=Eleginops maclovinus TaxID=56733 RepID=A0AAN7XJY1_ELEMC|nr:hypothetical protein PBY51_017438 [Eleginops maclovinus]
MFAVISVLSLSCGDDVSYLCNAAFLCELHQGTNRCSFGKTTLLQRSKVGEVQHIIPVTTSQKKEANQHGPSAWLPWFVAALSLLVNVISIIVIMFLWHTRKKVKPNQEDRTYMSIKKTDVSSDYEVIAQPLN